jgi:uncharacterized protein (TIGR03083 family)
VPLEPDQYLDRIATDSEALAAAVATGPLDAPVTACHGWTVRDLGAHIGQVQRWATGIVATTAQERPPFGERPDVADAALANWVREGTAGLIAALRSADPDARLWTFTFDRQLPFWLRRQAQEVSVHRWDAQDAVGGAAPLDAALAADGIDEWLELLAVRGPAATDGAAHSLHLHCTDVDGEWLVRRSADGLDIERAHAKGDVAARGTSSDVDLYLWGRVSADRLEVFGDPELLEALRAAGAHR